MYNISMTDSLSEVFGRTKFHNNDIEINIFLLKEVIVILR